MNVGEKIRKVRIAKKMTQSELAGDFITRNMLSRIENGCAMPSVPSLVYIAGRLGVPAGYFLAEGDEELLYRRRELFPDIVRAYRSGDWEIGRELCASLDQNDGEVALACTLFNFNIAKDAFCAGNLRTALELFDRIYSSLSAETVFPVTWLMNVTATYLIAICDISPSFDTVSQLPKMPPDTDGSDSFCNYFRAYRRISAEGKYPDRLPSENDAFSHHIRGAVHIRKGDMPKAYTELKEALRADEQIPTPVMFCIFRDLETCCREMNDFKGAYEYSGIKAELIERFLKVPADPAYSANND